MRVHVVASLGRGLAPFTRRDLAGLAEKGHDVFVLPTKVASSAVVPAGVHLAYRGPLARVASALVGLCRLLRTEQAIGVPLEQAPRPALRNRTWIVDMLRFCLSNEAVPLKGMPLAILANGHLQTFGKNPPGWIYLADEQSRALFPNHSEWFLDPLLVKQADLTSARDVGLLRLTPTEVVKRLIDVCPGKEGSAGIAWDPDGLALPNEPWLTAVYEYLAQAGGARAVPAPSSRPGRI